MSRIEDNVCKKIQERAKVGLEKYGVTMEREDFSTLDWLQYLQEELMDAIVYIERLMEVLEIDKTVDSLMEESLEVEYREVQPGVYQDKKDIFQVLKEHRERLDK